MYMLIENNILGCINYFKYFNKIIKPIGHSLIITNKMSIASRHRKNTHNRNIYYRRRTSNGLCIKQRGYVRYHSILIMNQTTRDMRSSSQVIYFAIMVCGLWQLCSKKSTNMSMSQVHMVHFNRN